MNNDEKMKTLNSLFETGELGIANAFGVDFKLEYSDELKKIKYDVDSVSFKVNENEPSVAKVIFRSKYGSQNINKGYRRTKLRELIPDAVMYRGESVNICPVIIEELKPYKPYFWR